MRHLFEIFPEAPAERSADHQEDLRPPDDDDLVRPAVEEELFRVGAHGTLAGRADAPLAKHLLWTFGPWHRALPSMLQLRVELDGDVVVTCDPEVGWLHQGLEKACAGASWDACFDLLERANPGRPEPYLVAWALVVERLHGVVVPPRAALWRTALLEAARIVAHARVLERTILRTAPIVVARALRGAAGRLERVVDGLREGGDPLRSIGGLARPIDDDARLPLTDAARACGDAARALSDTATTRPEVREPFVRRGAATRELALAHAFTGPALRATGVADDLRVQEPVLGWLQHAPRVVVHEGGCAYARALVRVDEIATSAELLAALCEAIGGAPPAHRVDVDPPAAPPPGAEVCSLEADGGELALFVVADGGATPARVRLRTPSFPLAAALPSLLVGARLDDVVPVLHSLGLVGNEIDR